VTPIDEDCSPDEVELDEVEVDVVAVSELEEAPGIE